MKPYLNSGKYLPLNKAAENPALPLSRLLPLLCAWASGRTSTALVPMGSAKWEGEGSAAFLRRVPNWCGLSAALFCCFVGSLEQGVDPGILFPRPDSSDRVVLSCARGLTRGIVTAFLRSSVLEVLSSRTVHHS